MPVFGWENSIIDWANSLSHQGVLFQFMDAISDFSKMKWLILVGLIVLVSKVGIKSLVTPVLLAGISVGLGDLASRRIVKALVMRTRPHYVGLDCHMSSCWGFVSSHSTNVTAAATVLILYDRRNAWWTIPFVILVGFSRVYLSDHFPLDVIGGTILGAIIGALVWAVYQKIKTLKKAQEVQT